MLLKDGSNDDMRKLVEESEEEVVAEKDESMLMRCLETCHSHCSPVASLQFTSLGVWSCCLLAKQTRLSLPILVQPYFRMGLLNIPQTKQFEGI